MRLCCIGGCGKKHYGLGWCQMHYRRWVNNGEPLALRTPPFPDRFWIKVNKSGPVSAHRPELGPCWVWENATDRAGYGKSADALGAIRLAHRIAYELLVGDIPTARPHLDHLCRNIACVNPRHLEPVTQAENNRRAGLARMNCKRGHPLTDENIYRRPGGTRECRTCIREQPSRQS